MRKLLTLLTIFMLAATAMARDVVFDATVDIGNYSGSAGPYTVVKDGVTMDVTKGMANGSHYRIYKGETMTIKSQETITGIKIECIASDDAQYGPGCFTCATPTYTYSGKIGTWVGSATEIVFKAESNQVRATKITVTLDDGSLAAPTITPGSGTFYEPFQATIACRTTGAKIYYTTNGSNPTTSSTLYTAPINVTSNMTIKAISELDGETSDVVTAQYVFSSERLGLGGLANVADGTDVTLGYDATVLAAAGQNLYVKDNTGYGLVYGGTGQTYELGDIIPSGYGGQKTTYNGEPELKNPVGFGKGAHVDVAAEQITASQVDHAHWAHYVVFKNATISMTDDANGTLSDASGSCPIYNRTFGAALPTDGQPYDIYAIVGAFKPASQDNVTYQVLPLYVDGFDPIPQPGTGLGGLKDLADGTNVTMDYDAIVLWQHGSTMYAKDETGYGLLYGNVGITYNIGDVITKGYKGQKTTYNNQPELQSLSGLQPSTTNVAVTPDEITCNQVNVDYWAHYVVIRDVKASGTGPNGTFTDRNGNSCDFFTTTFGVSAPADNQYHTVYGIVAAYRDKFQILPISFDEAPTPPGPQPEVFVASIDELYDLESGKQATFTTELVAVYHNRANLYVQDATGKVTLIYSTALNDMNFENGDIFKAGLKASWSLYQGNKQMSIDPATLVKIGHGSPVLPELLLLEDASQDNVHNYYRVDDATITKEGNDYYMDDGTDRHILFNRFNIEIPEDNNTHSVWCFLTVYSGKIEFYPISIDVDPAPSVPFVPQDVNQDGAVNIADVNAVIAGILNGSSPYNCDVNGDGAVNIADLNDVINYIFTH